MLRLTDFIDRRNHVRRCWKQIRSYKVVERIIFVGIAYEVYVESAGRIGLPHWANPEFWPLMPLSWAVVILLCMILLLVIEGSYRLCGNQSELQTKVLRFGRDLFAFMREHPQPSIEITNKSSDEAFEEIWESNGPYVEAIHFGYLMRFKKRGEDLFLELQKEHVAHDIKDWEISPPQAVRAETVRKIAKECFLISARMDIERETSGS